MRIFCSYSNGSQIAIMSSGCLCPISRLCHHKTTCAEFEVHQFHHIGGSFKQGVLAANATIRSAERNKYRGIGRTYNNEIYAGIANNKLPARVFKTGGVQPCCAECRNGVAIERTLRNSNTQGFLDCFACCLRFTCFGSCSGHGLFQIKGKAGGRSALSIRSNRVVIATATAKRRTNVCGICRKHNTCVVIKRTHDRKINQNLLT